MTSAAVIVVADQMVGALAVGAVVEESFELVEFGRTVVAVADTHLAAMRAAVQVEAE